MVNQVRHKTLDIPTSEFYKFKEMFVGLLNEDSSFKAEYQSKMWLSKLLINDHTSNDELRKQRAIAKWLATEVRNSETNQRLLWSSDEDILLVKDGFPISAEDIIITARRFIRQCIGDEPDMTRLKGSYSGGASTGLRSGVAAVARKYQMGNNITKDAIMRFLPLTVSSVWYPRDFIVVEGNVMFTVPKTSEIDRCAAKEPELNMYIQKAAGNYLRNCLRRMGIDLNDQTHNQRLAQQGSIENSLATIDLSSASDSVTIQLVIKLLPFEWYSFLDEIRSHYTFVEGSWHLNEMFSSMGNGFTFELESLLFWALTRSVAYHLGIRGTISVYGDDIICPSGLYDSLIETLSYFGFQVNTSKSFNDGAFRESCGKHWFHGFDVTPFFTKRVPIDVSDWIHLLNSLRKWCDLSGICDPRYANLWQDFAVRLIPKPLWGGWDLSDKQYLVAPGRWPIAKCTRKLVRMKRLADEYSFGCYVHWLDATELRQSYFEIDTTTLVTEKDLCIQRSRRSSILRDIPLFPQEIE